MWELDYKESWALKNWCFWTVVLEKTLESPLDRKEIQLIHHKGNQFWMFIGRTDAEAETPIVWPPDVKNWLICKDPNARKDWRREEKGMTEDEIVGWHHQLNGVWVNSIELVMDREAWRAVVHGVAKSWTRWSDWTELIHLCPSSWTSLPPHPGPLDCLRSPDLSSLHHIANFHWLPNFICGNVICFSATLSICPTISFPHCVQKSKSKIFRF